MRLPRRIAVWRSPLLTRTPPSAKAPRHGGCGACPADGTVELRLQEDEALTGGVASLSFETDIVCRLCAATLGAGCERCADTGREHERVSFWLRIPARIANGTVLYPSVEPLKLVRPIAFVVRVSAPDSPIQENP
jgi:hypothetical protein